jgi:hypothetical protein
VRLELDTRPALYAEMSPEDLRMRGLSHGVSVWATLDAAEIEVYSQP